MSWFDTASLTTFAKTALTQAQKSIDKVLDIDEEDADAKRESIGVKAHKTERKSSEVPLPKQSTSALSLKGKSPKRTSSSSQLLHDAQKSKEDSFWSSFLGSETSENSRATKSKNGHSKSDALGSRVNIKVSDQKDSDLKTAVSPTGQGSLNTTSKELDLSLNNEKVKKDVKNKHDKSQGINRRRKQLIDKDLSQKLSMTSVAQNTTEENEKSDKNFADLKTNTVNDTKATLDEYEKLDNELSTKTEIIGVSIGLESPAQQKSKDTSEQDNSDGSTVSVELSEAITLGQQKVKNLKQNGTQIEGKENVTDTNKKESDEVTHSLKSVETPHAISKMSKQDQKEEVCVDIKNREIAGNKKLFKDQEKGEEASSEQSPEITDGSAVSVELTQALACKESQDVTASNAKQCQHEATANHEQNKELDDGPLAHSTPNLEAKRRVKEDEKEEEDNIVSFCPDKGDGSAVSIELAESISCTGKPKRTEQDPIDLSEASPMKEVSEEQLLGKASSSSNEDTRSEGIELQSSQIETLQKELKNMRTILEVRESKILCLSKENVDLQEANSILRNQIIQLEEIQKTDDAEMEELRQEFTFRIAEAENSFHTAAKERDQFKANLKETKAFFTQSNEEQTTQYLSLLKEKDEQISDLLSEGEKLSKQQLQSNNIIKKLRAKEKESDALIKKQSKRLEDTETELKRLTEVLKIKDQNEQKHEDGIVKLNAYVKKQEEQIAKQSSDLEDAHEKIRSMQTTLDNAYKEIAELHRQNAAKDGVVQEAALSAEMMAKEERRIALEKTKREFQQQEDVLTLQISDLQSLLNRTEQQGSRREDNLRQEISDLQQRLQESEARNQELAESVTLATRPLLRQIENLQNTHGNQALTWERIERNLTERISDSQKSLATAQEKERIASEYAQELHTRVTSLEAQLSTFRQEKARLAAELEMNQAKLEAAEEAKTKESARLKTLQAKYKKMLEDAKVEKTLVEQQLAVEQGKLDAERKKMQVALEEKDRQLFTRQSSSISSVPPSPTLIMTPGGEQNDSFEDHKPLTRSGSTSSTNSSVIDGISRGVIPAGTALVERLQAQLRQKDGEIEMLQEDVITLQNTREELTEELTQLTQKIESLEKDSVQLRDLKEKYKETEQRYNAVLQMYGEKEEETEELRLDLEDVKAMYKAQIQELLGGMR